jgi:hypothetical protein
MEVVNSGAQQTDVLQLFRDWMHLLNRGSLLTPVGSSDSHDVSRYIVGQGRTYVRCDDAHPGRLDVRTAVDSLRHGRVLVGCGLLADSQVNGKYLPGDLAPAADEVRVAVRVLGPGWARADHVALYANGIKIREARIDAKSVKAGVQWAGEWTLPRFRHDVHLVAIASGPGVTAPYWPIARPYQPTSPKVVRRVVGATGAVWLDADGDGKRTCAFEYARRLAAKHGTMELIAALADHDEAVAAQAASLLQKKGVSLEAPELRDAVRRAGPHVERGVEAFAAAGRECRIAGAPAR